MQSPRSSNMGRNKFPMLHSFALNSFALHFLALLRQNQRFSVEALPGRA